MANPAPEWTHATGEYLNHAIGRLGERDAAFFLGQNGWVVMYGPGGSTRFPRNSPLRVHQPTTKGLDMIAFNPHDGTVLILDNKAGGAAGVIDEVSAFEKDFAKKLKNRIGKLERAKAGLPGWAAKDMEKVIGELKQAERALAGNGKWPAKVRLAVSNAAGNATGMSGRLAKKLSGHGIQFLDISRMKAVAKPTKARQAAIKAVVGRLRRATSKAELEALEKLAEHRITGKGAARVGAEVLEKTVAKATGKALLRASAKAAARRTASLLPIIGWGFSARDAACGVEDILRGHTARGLAGIGMAIADVSSDLLHLGDAVSGVGGTALSLGIQGGLVAGQLALEMDRAKEKMEALEQEIHDKGTVPDDRRLRDEFGLDDEAIADLKKNMTQPDTTPPTANDLPPPPDWGGPEEDREWPDLPTPAAPNQPVPLIVPAPGNIPFWQQPIA